MKGKRKRKQGERRVGLQKPRPNSWGKKKFCDKRVRPSSKVDHTQHGEAVDGKEDKETRTCNARKAGATRRWFPRTGAQ